jgi:diacylglycerol kinase family enzyme
MSQLRFSYLFPTVYYGRHLTVPEVEYFQADRLRLEIERPSRFMPTGKYRCQTPIELAVEPAALEVITIRA